MLTAHLPVVTLLSPALAHLIDFSENNALLFPEKPLTLLLLKHRERQRIKMSRWREDVCHVLESEERD